jgi:regulator of cell morphogenesis and NO signaling
MQIVPETTVGQLVAARPGRSRLFEQLGIDYCCGGRKPLAQVCQEKGLDLENLIQRIAAHDARAEEAPETLPDVAAMNMTDLVEHIERTHHAWLRTELPRLASLLGKVADAHGERDRRLVALYNTFEEFAYHLFSHMQKEERILFPALRRLERGELAQEQQHSLDSPIDAMTREHDEAGSALRTMRELTDDFVIPDNACNTHRAVLDALSRLEADMHQHVHKENNVLFPMARRAAGLATA